MYAAHAGSHERGGTDPLLANDRLVWPKDLDSLCSLPRSQYGFPANSGRCLVLVSDDRHVDAVGWL